MASHDNNNQFRALDNLKFVQTTVQKTDLFQEWSPLDGEKGLPKRLTEADLLKKREEELGAFKAQLEAERENITNQSRQIAEALSKVNDLLQGFEGLKKEHWSQNAEELVDFAVALAEKIVQDKILEDPSILVRQIQTVLADIKTKAHFDVHINPEDLEHFQKSNIPDIKAFLTQHNLTWVADIKLKRGEVFIDTENYRLDASIHTALKNLREDLNKTPAQGLDNMEMIDDTPPLKTIADSAAKSSDPKP